MCNEEMLRKLLDEKLQEQKQEITNAFIEEINKLKAEQSKVIKEAISESLKENYERIFEKKLNDIDKKIEASAKHLNENDIRLAKLLESAGKQLVEVFKTLNEKEEKTITKYGDAIMDALEEISKALITAHDSITDLQNSWGDTMLKNFKTILEGEVTLKRMLDGIQSSEKDRFDLLYSVTKSTKDLIDRKSFGI